MRVIAGSLRSRPLRAPKGDATRPTSDRVRESLFAIVGDVRGLRVLDLYAGSGALAIEALSRGAAGAVCVESSRRALDVIAENIASLGLGGSVRVIARRVGDAAKMLAPLGPFDLVLIDPPYADVPSGALARELRSIVDAAPLGRIFAEGALVVVEHASRDEAPKLPGLTHASTRAWGDTAASFYDVPMLDGRAAGEGEPT